jgi:hypothetical protein
LERTIGVLALASYRKPPRPLPGITLIPRAWLARPMETSIKSRPS